MQEVFLFRVNRIVSKKQLIKTHNQGYYWRGYTGTAYKPSAKSYPEVLYADIYTYLHKKYKLTS
jgi:hypothetical protein